MTTLFRLLFSSYTTMKVVLVIALALTIAACDKNEEKYELVKIDKTLYPFLFDKGTQWVYQKGMRDSIDSLTVIMDTIKVEAITKDTISPLGLFRSYEIYDIKYFSSLKDSTFNEQLIGYVITKGQVDGGFVLLSSKKKGDKSLNAEIVNVSDEMTVEDVTYKKVVKMKVSKDQFIKDSYYLYYVDQVGMIKKEKLGLNAAMKEDSIMESWTLIKSDIQLFKAE